MDELSGYSLHHIKMIFCIAFMLFSIIFRSQFTGALIQSRIADGTPIPSQIVGTLIQSRIVDALFQSQFADDDTSIRSQIADALIQSQFADDDTSTQSQIAGTPIPSQFTDALIQSQIAGTPIPSQIADDSKPDRWYADSKPVH